MSVESLEKNLGYRFQNRHLLNEALTHKSYHRENNNERLEFLGDAVLDLIVGEFLFHKFPESNEGELSKMRASLVNEKGFTKMAYHIDLGDYIYISSAEENNKGRKKPSLLSNAFEAIMGAIYLEAGLEEVRRIMDAMLEEVYPKIDLSSLFKDYKTTLQEVTQARFGKTPEYHLVRAMGPDHKKEFEIQVNINGKNYAIAKGKSKKEAQQESARIALEKLQEEGLLVEEVLSSESVPS